MKVLLFGETGQLGRELARRAGDVTLEILGRDAADFTNPDICAGFVTKTDADAVINAVAYTAVDKAEDDEARTYLHRGIATRAFERRFQLADHVRVTGATHADGMLHIDLMREMPEALKPRQIEIASGDAVKQDVVDAKSVN